MNKEATIDIENPKDNDLISRQDVLDKIRAEIEKKCEAFEKCNAYECANGLNWALKVIDKHMERE